MASRDVIRSAHQVLTKQWWNSQRDEFELFTSQFVMDESSAGDQTAAAERITVLNEIELLEIPSESEGIADRLLRDGAMPKRARIDALHLAVATLNGMQYLLTWNCKHLANARLWRKIEQSCRTLGYQPPSICTPYELLGERP